MQNDFGSGHVEYLVLLQKAPPPIPSPTHPRARRSFFLVLVALVALCCTALPSHDFSTLLTQVGIRHALPYRPTLFTNTEAKTKIFILQVRAVIYISILAP